METNTNIFFLLYKIGIKLNLCNVGWRNTTYFINLRKKTFPFFSDIPVSVTHSSGFEIPLTVHSYPRSTSLPGDQEAVSFLSAITSAHLPYHTLEENSRPPTPDPYHQPLRLDKWKFIHPRHILSYFILPVNRINNCLQLSTITRNRERNRLTYNRTEGKLEATVIFNWLSYHSFPTSTQIKHRTFPCHFVAISLRFTSKAEPPSDHQLGTISFYNSISGLKHKKIFRNLWIYSL